MANVGGPGLEAQMEAFAPEHVEELVRVYRAHNEPLHDSLEAFLGIELTLTQLREQGRALGLVTAKRRATVDLAFARLPIAHYFDTVVGGDETERHKPHPEPLLLGLERLGAGAGRGCVRRRLPVRHAGREGGGLYAVGVTWGGIHDRAALAAADVIVDTAEELLAVL